MEGQGHWESVHEYLLFMNTMPAMLPHTTEWKPAPVIICIRQRVIQLYYSDNIIFIIICRKTKPPNRVYSSKPEARTFSWGVKLDWLVPQQKRHDHLIRFSLFEDIAANVWSKQHLITRGLEMHWIPSTMLFLKFNCIVWRMFDICWVALRHNVDFLTEAVHVEVQAHVCSR